ncbi:FKBP-type peptidyl-prolyl cis-trans isomerase [Gordonia alkaliphila]|uniref:FKBP-type peptidyl-prolyl cis-trans isomerase n=1 Tax=Gordonia alkaliphila TaxID=1053547 RepID=UPI001FF5CBA0|nr:FKBP-type peptidyl-prolyl cis-trans isomerase [Gordonia alkaliphila]MCK0441020.1 FKBP-type peptidyl-prolyl cis-trans isomerase [Gordonia alkaliphila]
MRLKPMLLLPVAASALLLVGCSSDDSSSSADTTGAAQSATDGAVTATSCPSTEPAADTAPQWTVTGTTGSIAVVGQTDTTAPLITVKDKPFTVDKTEVKTLEAGDGAVVTDSEMISVCYQGVNGATGEVFDSAYARGEAAEFSAGGVIPGFAEALVGQKKGSSVAVVIPSTDGYPQGTPDGSIKPGDTIIFALKILDN